MSANIVNLSGAAFCLAPSIGGLLVELFSWPQKRIRPPIRPGYDVNYAALEAVASSAGKNVLLLFEGRLEVMPDRRYLAAQSTGESSATRRRLG